MNIRIGLPVLLFILLSLPYCTGDKNKKTGQTAVPSETESKQIDEDIVRARTMGLAYLEEGDLEAAETEFQKLIELAPQEAIGYANIGLIYLRMGRYQEAETLLKKAIDLDPEDPDIRLNLAKVYEYSDKGEKSVKTLERTIEIAPDHVQTLYSLAESYSGSPDRSSMELWEKYMQKVVDSSPANIVPRLHLTEVLLRNNKSDLALYQMEEIERLFPEFHDEARRYYDQAIVSLQTGKPGKALTDVLIFHNLLKLTNPYQKGIAELKGNSGAVGVPVLTFSEGATVYTKEGKPF